MVGQARGACPFSMTGHGKRSGQLLLALLAVAGGAGVVLADTACRDVPGGGFCLSSPDWVWLGELTANQVYLSETGELSFSPVGPVWLELRWRRWGRASWRFGLLWFRAIGASPNLRWQAVEWRTQGGTFSPLPPRNRWQILGALARGEEGMFPLEFRYLPTLADLPGKYELRLQFRLDLYLDRPPYRVWTQSALTFQVYQWCILTIPASHMDIALGTIGPELYEPETNTWTPLTSQEVSLYAATNSPQGMVITAVGSDLGPQPADLSRLLLWGGALEGVPLDAPRQVLVTDAPGLYRLEDLRYQYLPSWQDRGGTYLVRITYTLLAP